MTRRTKRAAGTLAHRSARLAAGLCAAFALSGAPARASDFYQGRQINFIVSADAGNSYDTFARIIARYLTKYIPGHPVLVVQNMPGAGGLRAADWLYSAAPRDGLTIGMINNTLAFDPLYGDPQAQFDSTKFNWLGSPSKETGVFVVWHTLPVANIEEAAKRTLVLSATGTGSTPAFFARVLSAIFKLKIKLIPGYKSQSEAFLAMERGENDGNASPFWSSLTAETPQWLRDKKLHVLVYYGPERISEIPGPYFYDLVKDPGDRALMQVAQAGLAMGRPMVAPPGVDPGKVAVLRAAVMKVFADPEYKSECARARLNCSSPSSGADLLGLIRTTYASPKEAVAKISAIYREGQKK